MAAKSPAALVTSCMKFGHDHRAMTVEQMNSVMQQIGDTAQYTQKKDAFHAVLKEAILAPDNDTLDFQEEIKNIGQLKNPQLRWIILWAELRRGVRANELEPRFDLMNSDKPTLTRMLEKIKNVLGGRPNSVPSVSSGSGSTISQRAPAGRADSTNASTDIRAARGSSTHISSPVTTPNKLTRDMPANVGQSRQLGAAGKAPLLISGMPGESLLSPSRPNLSSQTTSSLVTLSDDQLQGLGHTGLSGGMQQRSLGGPAQASLPNLATPGQPAPPRASPQLRVQSSPPSSSSILRDELQGLGRDARSNREQLRSLVATPKKMAPAWSVPTTPPDTQHASRFTSGSPVPCSLSNRAGTYAQTVRGSPSCAPRDPLPFAHHRTVHHDNPETSSAQLGSSGATATAAAAVSGAALAAEPSAPSSLTAGLRRATCHDLELAMRQLDLGHSGNASTLLQLAALRLQHVHNPASNDQDNV